MNIQEEALHRVLSTGRMRNNNGEPVKSKLKLASTVIATDEWPAPEEVVREMDRLDQTKTHGYYIRIDHGQEGVRPDQDAA